MEFAKPPCLCRTATTANDRDGGESGEIFPETSVKKSKYKLFEEKLLRKVYRKRLRCGGAVLHGTAGLKLQVEINRANLPVQQEQNNRITLGKGPVISSCFTPSKHVRGYIRGYICSKGHTIYVITTCFNWYARRDSNSRPPGSKPGALSS